MASFVSARPISGTVPSSSFVAGSAMKEKKWSTIQWPRTTMTLTSYDDFVATFGVNPLPIDECLKFNQSRLLQSKLVYPKWVRKLEQLQLRFELTTEACELILRWYNRKNLAEDNGDRFCREKGAERRKESGNLIASGLSRFPHPWACGQFQIPLCGPVDLCLLIDRGLFYLPFRHLSSFLSFFLYSWV